jgi:hypothetical protein
VKSITPTDEWPAIQPCLLIGHFDKDYGATGPYQQFHAIALWDTALWNPWDVLIKVVWQPGDPFEPGDVTPAQLAVASMLIHNPVLISHQCMYCNSRFGVPHHTYWGDSPCTSHDYGIPACCYDGTSWPATWTGELWPPVYPDV